MPSMSYHDNINKPTISLLCPFVLYQKAEYKSHPEPKPFIHSTTMSQALDKSQALVRKIMVIKTDMVLAFMRSYSLVEKIDIEQVIANKLL